MTYIDPEDHEFVLLLDWCDKDDCPDHLLVSDLHGRHPNSEKSTVELISTLVHIIGTLVGNGAGVFVLPHEDAEEVVRFLTNRKLTQSNLNGAQNSFNPFGIPIQPRPKKKDNN